MSLFGMSSSIPTESFEYLGISSDSNIDDVKKAYKKKALILHPDKGGTEEKFLSLSTHYQECLKYLS